LLFSDPLGARNRFFETLSPSLRLKEPLGESPLNKKKRSHGPLLFSDPLGARNRFFETLSPSLRLKEPLGESP
ncbi:MAG: hypothetical protein UHT92_09605, partial [Prevotella sp.]|nr:hypothetical protein [Prevotella sp.]